MIEAWLSASEITASSLVEQRLEDAAVGVEARAEQHGVLRAEEAATAAASSVRCMVCVPQMKRTDAMP